jgi:hypothetical protein
MGDYNTKPREKVKGIKAQFTYLLDVMLRRRGYDYGKELIAVLNSDQTDPKNEKKLETLFRLMPYIAVKFTDTEIKQIEDYLSKVALDRAVTETKQKDKAEELNRITLIRKDQAVAIGGTKT